MPLPDSPQKRRWVQAYRNRVREGGDTTWPKYAIVRLIKESKEKSIPIYFK